MQLLILAYAEWVVKGVEAGVLIPDQGQFRCITEQPCSDCLIVDLDSETDECMCSSLLNGSSLSMNEFERACITPLLTKSHPEYFL